MRRSIAVVLVVLCSACGPGDEFAPASAPPTPPPEAPVELPDFRKLWNFQDPAGTEAAFREILPQIQAAGDEDYEAELWTQIGRALGLQRKFDEAHAILDTVESMLRDEAPRPRVRYLLERGRTFNSSGKPVQAVPLFEQAFEVAKTAELHGLAVDAAHMVAIAAPPAEQLAWSEKAIAYIDDCGDPSVRGWLGPLLNNTGWTYHGMGEYEKALDLWQRGVDFRTAEGGRTLVIAHWTVGRCLRSLGRLDEALAKQHQVVKMWEDIGETPSGYTHEEIGEILLAQGKTADDVRPHFAEAWDLLKGETWMESDEPDRYARLRRLAGADDGHGGN